MFTYPRNQIIMQIWNHTFEIRETVMVRQAQVMAKLSKQYEAWEIDDIDMAVKTICVMVIAINGNPPSEDWLKDNLDPGQLWELSNSVMEVVNEFVKKNKNLNTNTKPIWTDDDEVSLKSGE